MSLRDVVRQIHGPTDLSSDIDRFISTQEKQFPSNREEGWHPSEFCGACARALVINSLVVIPKKEIKPKLRRIFDVGTSTHRLYQEEYLGPMGVLWGKWRCSRCHTVKWGFMPKRRCACTEEDRDSTCFRVCGEGVEQRTATSWPYTIWSKRLMENRGGCIHCGVWGHWEFREIPFKSDNTLLSKPIVGHSDGLIRLGTFWIVLEIKTINSYGFAALREPKENHVLQGTTYTELVLRKKVRRLPGEIQVPTPDELWILYVGKNTSDEKVYKIPIDMEMREKGARLLEKPELVDQSIEKGVLPLRLVECDSKKAKRAKKCAAKKYCFAKEVTFAKLKKLGEEQRGRLTK